MAVPARPASGAPIDSAWGGVAHDTAVAQDIQSGVAHVNASAGYAAITFPRPFAGVPVVVASVQYNSSNKWYTTGPTPTATGATIYVREVGGANVVPTNAVDIAWVAIGPRA